MLVEFLRIFLQYFSVFAMMHGPQEVRFPPAESWPSADFFGTDNLAGKRLKKSSSKFP